MQQFQYILLLLRCWHHKEPFVDDEQNRICILLQHLHVGAFIPCHSEIDQKVRETNIFGFVVLLAGFHTEGTGHVSLPTAGRAGDEDIAILRNIFASGKASDQFLVQLAAGSVIDIGYLSFRLIESSALDQSVQSILLAAVVFEILNNKDMTKD